MTKEFQTHYFNKFELARQFAIELAQQTGERSIKLNRHNGGFNVYAPNDASQTVKLLLAQMGQSIANNPVTTGVFGVGIFNLLSINQTHEINPLVLEAFQRSTSELNHASQEEVANYLQAMEPEQIQGLINNVKGIYHELSYIANENTNGDEWTAVVHESTNHAGSDVILSNNLTGEIQELQLKATDSTSYALEHLSNYPDINMQVTSEVASATGIESSGLSNEVLTSDVTGTVEGISSDAVSETVLSDTLLDFVVPGAAIASAVATADSNNKNKSPRERDTAVKKAAVKSGIASLALGLMFGIF